MAAGQTLHYSLYLRLIVLTVGTLLPFFWIVVILGHRRQRNFEHILLRVPGAGVLFWRFAAGAQCAAVLQRDSAFALDILLDGGVPWPLVSSLASGASAYRVCADSRAASVEGTKAIVVGVGLSSSGGAVSKALQRATIARWV